MELHSLEILICECLKFWKYAELNHLAGEARGFPLPFSRNVINADPSFTFGGVSANSTLPSLQMRSIVVSMADSLLVIIAP